ncbi:hypothetical protein ACFROC_16670 [Nocardia tengchongensis]|uniref:hypothetical protein n=1 Tax=Nocardia tengchongensis TaxID=2055889 RepID=UPI0036A97C8B
MTASRYANSPAVAEAVEPSGWGRHLGVGDDIADSLDAGQLGTLIFLRKLLRCWYIANTLLALALGAGLGLLAWQYGQRTYGDCSTGTTCYPGWELLVLGIGSGVIAAVLAFVAFSLPCFVIGYAIRWSARAMADRNTAPEHHYPPEPQRAPDRHEWRTTEQPPRRPARTEQNPPRPSRGEQSPQRPIRGEQPARRPARGDQPARRPART